MSNDTLARELVEYFLGERKPMPVYALAKEYAGLAKFDLDWSPASTSEAVSAIRRAGELGLVDVRGDIVYPREQKTVTEKESSQMELF